MPNTQITVRIEPDCRLHYNEPKGDFEEILDIAVVVETQGLKWIFADGQPSRFLLWAKGSSEPVVEYTKNGRVTFQNLKKRPYNRLEVWAPFLKEPLFVDFKPVV